MYCLIDFDVVLQNGAVVHDEHIVRSQNADVIDVRGMVVGSY